MLGTKVEIGSAQHTDTSAFTRDLEEVIQLFESHSVDYRFVGSLGFYGQNPQLDFNPNIPNKLLGTPNRDIDIIYANQPYDSRVKSVEQMVREFNSTHSNTYLDDNFSRDRWIIFGEKSASLNHGRYNVEIPLKVFNKTKAGVLGLEYPTLPLSTLFHIMGVQGELRGKDMSKVLIMARTLRQHPSLEYPSELYEPFHEFHKGLSRFHFYTWYQHQRHQKIQKAGDPLGETYLGLPSGVKALQRKVAATILAAELQLVF